MATVTVTDVVLSTVTRLASSAAPTASNRATPQAGIIEGANPVDYNASNPIILFIVQVSG